MYRLDVLAVVLVTLPLSGCYRQWVSIGDMPADSGWRSEQHVAHSKFEGAELKLYVGTSNYSRSLGPAKQEFALSVRFYLKEVGFLFDPWQVRLVFSSTGEVTPKRIEIVASAAGWESAWQCGHRSRQRITDQMLLLNRETCFEFYFPVSPPSPDTDFVLRIHGLSRDSKPTELPEVHFRKGSFWVWDFLGR